MKFKTTKIEKGCYEYRGIEISNHYSYSGQWESRVSNSCDTLKEAKEAVDSYMDSKEVAEAEEVEAITTPVLIERLQKITLEIKKEAETSLVEIGVRNQKSTVT